MGFYCPPFFYALDYPNRHFKFEKRSQLFVRTHNEPLSVAMRVNNPARSPVGISLLIVVDHLRRRFARFKLCAHLLDLGCLLVQTRSELRNCRLEVLLLLRHRQL